MNIQRLEMMKQMLGRVVAGSWKPVQTLPSKDKIPTPFPAITVKNFDLSSWVERHAPVNKTCGFTACAVGHACFDEEFRKLGLTFDGNRPVFEGRENWTAVHRFFEITDTTASKLFSDGSYSNAKLAAVKHLPKTTREAQMVLNRITILIELGDERIFNEHVRQGKA